MFIASNCCRHHLKNVLSIVRSSCITKILSLCILLMIVANINAAGGGGGGVSSGGGGGGSNTASYDLPLFNIDRLKSSSHHAFSSDSTTSPCSSFAKNLIVPIASRGDPMPANINDILSLMNGSGVSNGGGGSDWSIKTCDMLCQVLYVLYTSQSTIGWHFCKK